MGRNLSGSEREKALATLAGGAAPEPQRGQRAFPALQGQAASAFHGAAVGPLRAAAVRRSEAGAGDAPWPGLRVHVQGTSLLILLLLAFWYALGWSAAVIGDALSDEDGAIVAVARTGDASDYEPLTNSEVSALQSALADAGYDPGPLDGMLGIRTRRTIDLAKAEFGLEMLPDRLFLTRLRALTGSPGSRSARDGDVGSRPPG